MQTESVRAHVNGVPIQEPLEQVDNETLRQRACSELLRQAAIDAELLDANDPAPQHGVISAQASAAIEALLDEQLKAPIPAEDVCRRYYAANQSEFAVGERIHARHILFGVIPGVDVTALRKRAEACLLQARCRPDDAGAGFASLAAELSNCPTGAQGGSLGWLTEHDCAPELARELFGHPEIGVLARLVHSRFGLHVVEVLAREPGRMPAFESVHAAVLQKLQRRWFTTSLRHFLQLLAGQADIDGVDLIGAETPLVQ